MKTYLHSWGTEPIMEGNKVKGVIFESKSGRQAVLGKIVIDFIGDGDLLPYAGIEFEDNIPPNFRIANLALCFWIAGVDLERAEDFKLSQPEKHAELMRESISKGGYPGYFKSCLKDQESVVWFHNRFPNKSQVDVEELTRIEFEGRKKMLITYDIFKKHFGKIGNIFKVSIKDNLPLPEGEYKIIKYKPIKKHDDDVYIELEKEDDKKFFKHHLKIDLKDFLRKAGLY